MQYPPTPSSSATYVPTTPNAPYMSPKDLPPSPVTPTHPLPGHGAHAGAPYMYAVGHGVAPGTPAHNGLMTPPTTPERARGRRGGQYVVHPMFQPSTLRFDVGAQLPHTFWAHHNPTDSFIDPPARCVCINVIGVFRVEVRAGPMGYVTAQDVLATILREMSQTPSGNEVNCFTIETRQAVAAHTRNARRVHYLGTRRLYNGLEVTQVSGGVVYCDLQLAITPA
ncbi:uncharacterized protein C8Q71DRAFT_858130 [Rhodofomes roseus]|uniref:DUF6699 domain-containing protein n=1 Tax=Rhodofomes roseus TaxID=34475 RepID=A0A4Y9Y0Y8_9APHY|nr:uncharacterized protein C8Q71DRAFT_858130 [Rhodofomes roseus]KAH9836118.1 hypothetical protein C8Q71DRAFT_858130 [Rhodofomes roseus]TFY55247.1 hypothetical protein EVJ58_g8371 [Rhodofomes roseus]